MSRILFLIIFFIFFISKNSLLFAQENICNSSDNLEKLIDKAYLFDENNPHSNRMFTYVNHMTMWMVMMARLVYFHGNGVELDYEKAIEILF